MQPIKTATYLKVPQKNSLLRGEPQAASHNLLLLMDIHLRNDRHTYAMTGTGFLVLRTWHE
jgi:hypothetical protein